MTHDHDENRWNDGECTDRVAEAVAAERARIREAVGRLPIGWTKPDDQFGPRQYEWVYRAAVLALLEETP